MRTLALVLLPLLSILGAFGTWTLGSKNGLFKGIVELIEQEDARFPGTKDSLVRSYTGIKAIDHQLQILVIFFAPVVDSSNGNLSLFSITGAGQFGAAWTLLMLEGMRQGNRGKVVSFIAVMGLLVQNISYTVTVPAYLFLYLLTSPVAKLDTNSTSALLVSTLDLAILPVSIIVGYIIPSVLMLLPPSAVSSELHQKLIALWQPFPAWTALTQWFLTLIFRAPSGTDVGSSSRPLSESYLSAVRSVYRFVFALSMITHIPVVAIALLPPSSFAGLSLTLTRFLHSSFAEVFVPYWPDLSYQVPNLATGSHTFLQWDIYVGSAAIILWAAVLHRSAALDQLGAEKPTRKGVGRDLLWKIPTFLALSGPMGAVARLLWERDGIVKQKVKGGI
ncbi:hypothetical protein B0O99DRAFT_511850 [Bisporella sp. PMI_857]|nr:hypothetical protein B0O99DRAFT_511850 [Bisporella sp. PMI_857]